jgi:thymidine kinase
MNSSKTSNLIMTAYNYTTLGKKIMVVKPITDTRSEHINSRAIGDLEVDVYLDSDMIINELHENVCCILVDECQFLSKVNVDNLRNLSRKVPVICYGLRTDYTSELFEGSKRLMEVADTIEEIKTVCVKCVNKKAIINAKYNLVNDKKIIIFDGVNKIDIGYEDKYQSMCWECWCE